MLKFNQVSKYFGNDDKVALHDLTFTINAGEFVFITGHSGSGKTTILRLLLREYRPSVGEIYFDDYYLNKISRRKIAKLRRQIGVVFQDYQLLDDLNVWENIALPLIIARQSRKEIKHRISELLQLLNLAGYEKAFPSELSGGEAQRIGLARALATAPKIVFADEPTGNLDTENAHDIINLLNNINQYGTTVIIATHNLDFVAEFPQCRHLILDRGHLTHDNQATNLNKIELKTTETQHTQDKTIEEKQKVKKEKGSKIKSKQHQSIEKKAHQKAMSANKTVEKNKELVSKKNKTNYEDKEDT